MVSFVCPVNLLYFIFVGLLWFCLWVYMYMCIFSHTFYCCFKPLAVHWAFAVLWSFPFFFFFLFSFFILLIFNFLKPIFYIYPIVCFSYCSFPLAVNLYINLLYLPLFNFAYLFFLSFLSSQHMLVLFSLLYSPVGTLH